MLAPMRKKKVNLEMYRKLLLEKREELIKRLYARRSQIAAERETDDESAFALQDVIKELAATNMEREIRTAERGGTVPATARERAVRDVRKLRGRDSHGATASTSLDAHLRGVRGRRNQGS